MILMLKSFLTSKVPHTFLYRKNFKRGLLQGPKVQQKLQEAYLDICGTPTKVITYGKWVEESFKEGEPRDIIVCIPGNPGVPKFYSKFMQILHERLGYPVWIAGHAGHDPPNNNLHHQVLALRDNERLYGLQSQIVHQQAFIESYVPKNARIHLIGHSIGAFMILQLLKNPSIHSRTVGNYLLFPTIEHLSDTPNGKLLTKVVRNIGWLLIFLSQIFTWLPFRLQSLLIQILTTCYSIPKMHVEPIINLFEPETIRKVFYMGLDEMNLVKERDNDVLRQNKKKIKLYYAAADGWAPQSYYKKLKKDIPDIDAQICSHNFEHDFIMRHSVEVGSIVADWIKK